MNKRDSAFLLTFILLIFTSLFTRPAGAQNETLTISLRRDFGYSSGTGDIQGRFSLRASGPTDLESVTYFISEEPIGTLTAPPFQLQFTTDDFPPGRTTISAKGLTTSGETLTANTITRNFVSSEAARQTTTRLIVYIVGGMALVMGVAYFIINRIASSGEPLPLGAPRVYGFYGGAICPQCQRPYSMHVYGLNLLTHRFDRCPHCGKWSLVQRASPEALAAAEKAEIDESAEKADIPQLDEEEKRRQQLDDSRFQDL